VPIESVKKINVSLSAELPLDVDQPTIVMQLTNDLGFGVTGLQEDAVFFVLAQLSPGQNGGSSEWQSYITVDDAGIANAHAATEHAVTGDFEEVGDGVYTYTFAQALTAYPGGPVFDEAKIHRVGVDLRTRRFLPPDNIPANNAPTDFLPTGGAINNDNHRLIVNDAACNACHDNLELHGNARFDVEHCVTCHNPNSINGETAAEPWGGSLDMKVMIHKIHYGVELANGYSIVGRGGNLNDYSNFVFSQDVRNCTTCHQESDQTVPQASNWREVQNRAACGTCHDDIDWAAGDHPGGIAFTDDSLCAQCHNETSGTPTLHVPVVHQIPEAEAAKAFEYNIVSVTGTGIGEVPVIEFSVTDPSNADAPYDIQNDSEFTTCAGGVSRLAIGIAWDTIDYTNVDSGESPGQPVSMNPLTACGGASTAAGGGVFSVTSPAAVPATASGTLAVTIDGHPAVDIDGTPTRIGVTNAIAYAPITDTSAVPRRNAVAIEKCNDCHNQLSIHGNNRTDNIEVCVTCHNPNATDINRRVGTCADELGTDDVSIDMKYMIHALHAGGAEGVPPYNVCGFGFPSTPHTYDFVYPGRLNNCEGCHEPGGYYPVDPSTVLGTTVRSGVDPATPTDDIVQSPNTAVCSTCHTSGLAASHMEQNGGDYNATKSADSTLTSSGVETCALCHGEGRSADVGLVHGVGTFEFN
jgi:OmcA/MtrC family decaheme c-type cytochrome